MAKQTLEEIIGFADEWPAGVRALNRLARNQINT
jgi:hypothetical protein